MKNVKLMKSIWSKKDFLGDEYSIKVWYKLLQDLTFEQLAAAIEKYAMTNTFPPSIAELRGQVVDIQSDRVDWADGWEEVLTAIRRYGYTDEKGALESMSPLTRETVKRLGWKQICQSDLDELMAIRANFRMIYQQKEERAREDLQLPQGFMEKAKAITANSSKFLE